ncbi:immunity 49 family protein [Williamsia sp. MIQD14]|uniref:immunity 49 family protein n=1 Tax=Williamsia sp. MIQD14 TaxID=3425703 RepID=UPI003DA10A0A
MNTRVVVPRHELALDLDDDSAREEMSRDAAWWRENSSGPDELAACIAAEERLFGLLCAADPRGDDLIGVARLLTDHHTALFDPRESRASVHTVDRWSALYWWGRLSIGSSAFTAAQNVSPAPIVGAASPHQAHLHRGLVALGAASPDWHAEISLAARTLGHASGTAAESAWFLDRPVITILGALWDGDRDGLTASVDQALHAHRAYWTATAPRRADPRGMFSLPITAVCQLAQASGMAVDVESPYVPDVVLQSDWYVDPVADTWADGQTLDDLQARLAEAMVALETPALRVEFVGDTTPTDRHRGVSLRAASQSIMLLARESEAEVTEVPMPAGMRTESAGDLFYRLVLDADETELFVAVAALGPDGIRAQRTVGGVVHEQGSRTYLLDLLDEVQALDPDLARALTRAMVSGRMRSIVTTPQLDAAGAYQRYVFTESDIQR